MFLQHFGFNFFYDHPGKCSNFKHKAIRQHLRPRWSILCEIDPKVNWKPHSPGDAKKGPWSQMPHSVFFDHLGKCSSYLCSIAIVRTFSNHVVEITDRSEWPVIRGAGHLNKLIFFGSRNRWEVGGSSLRPLRTFKRQLLAGSQAGWLQCHVITVTTFELLNSVVGLILEIVHLVFFDHPGKWHNV